MESILFILAAALVGLVIGYFIAKIALKPSLKKKEEEAKLEAKRILQDAKHEAENLKKDKILEAKEKYLQLKEEFEEEVSRKKNIVIKNEQKVKQREAGLNKFKEQLSRKEAELDSMKENVNAQLSIVKDRKKELENLKAEQVSKLEHVAGYSADQAKEEIISSLKEETEMKAAALVKEITDGARLQASKEAKKIVLQTIQRTAAEHAIENCVSIFNLESDDIKGKIIGREGRNIRALESCTGVELIVDDTPEAIIISGFDPVRREVARLSLHRLVTDGRIHPARIEEVVNKTNKNIEDEIIELGERTVIDLGINGLHPELIRIVGRMRFRSSYGQNLLQHSKEVARLCATMAAELGLNVKLAKRAGLLHDIGKVITDQPDLPHAILGKEMAEKYKEHSDVCNAIGAHHDEIEMTASISPIIQVCDALSGSRPGARREVMESYMKRLQDLEKMAMSFDGVNKCYAMQAGRELRVIIDAEQTSDQEADKLSYSISNKIEKEMQYPGQIKVTCIRETRSVSFAK